MCYPKKEEGLGIKDIRKFNVALLTKWKWRLLSEERGKWKEILISKYSMESGHIHLHLKEKSWWWRDLSKACGEGVSTGWFQKAIGWKIGEGDKARFWED